MAEIELKRRVKYAGDVHAELLKAGWDCCTAAEFLNNIPDAADVAPVRHGKWLPTTKWWQGGSAWKQCSECGILHLGKSNYCPNCGCTMDLEG